MLVVVLCIQGYVCTRICFDLAFDKCDEGVAGMMAGFILARGGGVGLIAGLALYLLLANNEKIKSDYAGNKERQRIEDEEDRQLKALAAGARRSRAASPARRGLGQVAPTRMNPPARAPDMGPAPRRPTRPGDPFRPPGLLFAPAGGIAITRRSAPHLLQLDTHKGPCRGGRAPYACQTEARGQSGSQWLKRFDQISMRRFKKSMAKAISSGLASSPCCSA